MNEHFRTIAVACASECLHIEDVTARPIRNVIAPRLRDFTQAHGLPEPTGEEWEEILEVFHENLDRLVVARAEEENDDEDTDTEPQEIDVWIGGRAFGGKGRPWGRVASSIVALYVCDFVDAKIRTLQEAAGAESEHAAASVVVDVRETVRSSKAWAVASNPRLQEVWSLLVASWVDEFERGGWREFEELRDGSGEVPQ